MKFKVTVEKTMTASGIVEVSARTADEAFVKVYKRITSGKLQTTDITWDDPEYDDDSFKATGDVEPGCQLIWGRISGEKKNGHH
jgi:hypothetical protein